MNQFHYKNYEPDFNLRFQAGVTFNRILDIAPYGATGLGVLEKQGENEFRCSLDIYSKQGPFMASIVGPTPEQALADLEEKIKKQIAWWRSHQGGAATPRIFGARPASVAS